MNYWGVLLGCVNGPSDPTVWGESLEDVMAEATALVQSQVTDLEMKPFSWDQLEDIGVIQMPYLVVD